VSPLSVGFIILFTKLAQQQMPSDAAAIHFCQTDSDLAALQ